MPVRLDRSSADFDQRFAALLAAKREVSADVARATRAIVDDVAARGDAALIEATRKFDRLELDAEGLRCPNPRGVVIRARPDRDVPSPAIAKGRTLYRRARRRTRLALERGRCRRALCTGRHRRLSVLGA